MAGATAWPRWKIICAWAASRCRNFANSATTRKSARARNDSDRQHLRETCMAEVNAQPEDLIATETAFMSGEELATAEVNYREMKERIESMGPVNMMALEEFNDCDQRFTFLTRERDDLLQSIADTKQAIAELDAATKEKFEHAFHAINKASLTRSTPSSAAAWRRCA